MSVTFLYPLAAWLFVLLPLLAWGRRGRREWVHRAIRAAVFAALIVAMMQPSLIRRDGAGTQVIVLAGDAASAGATALARVTAAMPRGDRQVVVRVPPGAIDTGLSRALAIIPYDSRGSVTLIAPPRAAAPVPGAAVAALMERGIALNTIALPSERPAITAVRVAPVRAGEAVPVIVTVEGDGAAHVVTARMPGRPPASAPIDAPGTQDVALTLPGTAAGFVPIRVAIDGARAVDAVAQIQPPLRLLYLGDRQRGAAAQLQRLLGAGFTVEEAATTADPARWPLLFVDDLPASRWPAAAQAQAMRAVLRDGTGMLVSGGQAAFGMGGYAAAPIAAALPVIPRQADKHERPSVALAIVIDSSGSMSGQPLDLARQVARQTVRKLTPLDWVGVVEFYGAKQWAVPMQHVRDSAEVERAIARMQPSGASVLFPALQEAYYGIKDVDARYKHILVISDGGVAEDRHQQLLRHIADDRVTVSTVKVGGGQDGTAEMAQWARLGNGRFYSVPDEFSLVSLDLVQPQVTPEPSYRGGDARVTALPAAGWWRTAGAGRDLPPVAGHATVRARGEAQVLWRAGDDPLLASWQYGAGRVTALMTEPLGAGTARWRQWPGYGAWLARIAALTARAAPDLDVSVAREGDRLTVAVQRLRDVDDVHGGAAPTIRLVDPAGAVIATAPSPIPRAPGLFESELHVGTDRPALIEVRDGDRIARAASVPGMHAWPLARLSELTGGWHREDAGEGPGWVPGAIAKGAAASAHDLWPWCALLALLLYLTDIAFRRRFAPFHRSAR